MFETIDLDINGFHHQASLHRAMGVRANKTIVYYHGGGFIFGSKDDLPMYAIKQLTTAGFDLMCMEYPKAPEMTLLQIVDFVEKQLLWFLKNCATLNLSSDYYLFGRSAGGYLALVLCKRMMELEVKRPTKLIVFYGYATLDDPLFAFSNDYYNKFPKMTYNDVRSAIEDHPVIHSNLSKRYPLYVYARQSGKWLHLLGINNEVEKHVVDVNIPGFPGVFVAASRYDKDVNYNHSLKIVNHRVSSMLFTSQSMEHEFDQKASLESFDLYEKLLQWLMSDMNL